MLRPSLALALSLCICSITSAQSLQYVSIGDTGCKAGYYCQPGNFQSLLLADSSVMYVAECQAADGFGYGVVVVKLFNPAADATAAGSEMQMHTTMVKTAFGADLDVSKERKKGLSLPGYPKVQGSLDVFENEEGNTYRIKSWTDGKVVAIMYVYKKGEVAGNAQNEAFLNGFQFAK